MGGGYLLIIIILLVVTNGITYGASQLTSESVSYTKDGKLTTVKSALDELITKSSKVDDLEKKITDYEKTVHYLADKVTVGDYVAYDAGTWETSAKLPTKQGDFGGYTQWQSKNASVACGNYTTNLNGWRVLFKDEKTKTVTIIHAGQPECYYHGTDPNESQTKLDGRAQDTYKDSKYAESAHAMTQTELNVFAIANDLRNTLAQYWLATTFDSNDLYCVRDGGGLGHDNSISLGFRPVIVLKSTVLTTGQGKDSFGNPAWILV